jgi:7-keto-8-aminopelargonate synthetase-like enzyme
MERFRFSHTRKLDSAYRYVSEAADAGVVMNDGHGANGRYVTVDGKRLRNFGSCSYMALETMPQLRESAHHAIDEYGTQFHFSRAYLQCALYLELEALLEQITGRPVLIAASTSLAHMSALPVLVRDSDHIIIDQFAHASLHTAVQLVPDVPLEILRHNRMDQLDTQLTRMAGHKGNVWYICDGLYSMHGDFAPFDDLRALLGRHDRLRLYIDDAHSTSWLGEHGRGIALEHFARDERVVVALSLNKAFSAAGGALALPERELVTRIRRSGGPMLFSGPIQPPMLGAAVGSARLHLDDEFSKLQAELEARLDLCMSELCATELALPSVQRSPIFQAQCDSPRIAFAVAEQMKARGFYCCVCVFPAVPMNRPGIRFTVTRHNHVDDLKPFVSALAASVEDANRGISRNGDDERREGRHVMPRGRELVRQATR